ncbi:hypothetical protein ACFTY8_35240 [Streptomyces mirabilis]|uniref:hypothetical protein n=1 Tax=Streptomyces mirabilis TaxID=68239 RepID=UPI00363CBA3B
MDVARLAWHGRERLLLLLRVRDGALVAHVLKWDDEVRDPSELAPKDVTVTGSEIDEALQLVDSMTTDDISGYRDEYCQALEAVIEAKAEGRQPPQPSTEAEEPGGKVVDLQLPQERRGCRPRRLPGTQSGRGWCRRSMGWAGCSGWWLQGVRPQFGHDLAGGAVALLPSQRRASFSWAARPETGWLPGRWVVWDALPPRGISPSALGAGPRGPGT